MRRKTLEPLEITNDEDEVEEQANLKLLTQVSGFESAAQNNVPDDTGLVEETSVSSDSD